MQAFAITNRFLRNRASPDCVDSLAATANNVARTPLSPTELEFARTAWSYFQLHTEPATGFCPERAGSNHASPWEFGANVLAIQSALNLGLLGPIDARARLETCLASLAGLALAGSGLPRRRYDIHQMRADGPSGPTASPPFSARQIMRLIAGFLVLARHHADLAPEISLILRRWDLPRVFDGGRFLSVPARTDGRNAPRNEEYLGYEQYAARTGCLIGLKCEEALDVRAILGGFRRGDTLFPGDKRHAPGKPAIITSDPFHLEAMEFGWRQDMLDIAASLFLAQKSRFERSGNLTALTEEVLDRGPGNSVQGIGAQAQPFASRSRDGLNLAHLRCLSAKAAFGWWALLPTPYSQKLLDAVSDLQTPSGWMAGIYEVGGATNSVLSLNTNAMILQALHYKSRGPMFLPPN